MVIPRSFDKAYSPGHSSIGDKALSAEFKGTFGVIFSRYHHASWCSWSRRNFARIKSMKVKVRFRTLPIALGILVLCSSCI